LNFKYLALCWAGVWASWGLARSPYSVLGLSETASDEEVKKAYLKKVKEFHPDTSALPPGEAQKKFKELQTAWEQIQKKMPRTHFANEDRARAREEAAQILEKAWEEGTFSAATVETLPRKKAYLKRSPLVALPGRGPKEEGEWEALASFLQKRMPQLMTRLSQPEAMDSLILAIQSYQGMTGTAVQQIRAGLLEPLEDFLLDSTADTPSFIKAVGVRMERLPSQDALLTNALAKMQAQAALALNSTLEAVPKKLAQELLEEKFDAIWKNPVRNHELGFLLPVFNAWLSPSDHIELLGNLLEKLESLPLSARQLGGVKSIQERAERAVERIFQKNPELKAPLIEKTAFWKRFFQSVPRCEILLGRLARRLQ